MSKQIRNSLRIKHSTVYNTVFDFCPYAGLSGRQIPSAKQQKSPNSDNGEASSHSRRLGPRTLHIPHLSHTSELRGTPQPTIQGNSSVPTFQRVSSIPTRSLLQEHGDSAHPSTLQELLQRQIRLSRYSRLAKLIPTSLGVQLQT